MKTVSDYRTQAARARKLARSASDERMRGVIEQMAATWEELAAERERSVREGASGNSR